MGLSNNAISRVVGVEVSYKSFAKNGAQQLPQRLAVFAQGNSDIDYPLDAFDGEGKASDLAERYGYGSPLHLAALQLYPETGTGASFPVTFFPVATPPNAVAAKGSVTITGSATKAGSGKIYIGGKLAEFAVAKGDTGAVVMKKMQEAVNSVLEMPVTAGEIEDGAVPFTAKWKGASGNSIKTVIKCSVPGLTFAASIFEDGALDPNQELQAAFKKMGNVWYTCLLNTWDLDNEDILDLFFAEGSDRWSVMNKKPTYAIVGNTDNYATRTAITDKRKEDYINALAVSVGSPELPASVAARWAFYALSTFDNNPAQDVKSSLYGLLAGSEDEQENYTVRNNALYKGSSTNLLNGSVASMNDFITMYHPDNAGKYPSKRYVVDIVKLQNIAYNVRLVMEDDDLVGAPLVTDKTITKNPKAIQPKTIRTRFDNLADALALLALIQNPDYTKKNRTVEISSENPKRLDCTFPVQLSGNIEVSSTDVFFAFYFGGAE